VPSSTVGVNFSPTPNSFSSSVMVAPPPSRDCATGMKILPPDRKLADWPLMAMMLGSASTRTRPSFFCASMPSRVAPRPMVDSDDAPLPTMAAGTVAPLIAAAALGPNFPSSAGAPPKMPLNDFRGQPVGRRKHAGKVDAELVEQGLAHFGDLHFQHHLLRRRHAQQVDHPLAVAVRAGNAHRFVEHGGGVAHFAGQHDGVFGALDVDAGFLGHQFGQLGLQHGRIDRDDDVEQVAGRLWHPAG
jgi:hypothetical protein